MNKIELLKIMLYLGLGTAIGCLAAYMLMPDKVVEVEKDVIVTVERNVCIDTPVKPEKQPNKTYYVPNGIRPMNQQSYPTEPHKAYYEYSNGSLGPVGSKYTNGY